MPTMSDNKRIAKNTLLLYFRQILIMLVSLYTGRVVLNVLGVDDFGIYNVVGGIVMMFSFVTGTMATASQRFLSYDLAKDDPVRLRQTFALIVLSYVVLSLVTIALSESLGVWFLNTHMSIPAERMESANWVLQFSILSFVASIMSAPYMAVIISRERMGVYAYASIVEVVLKLAIVYLLTVVAFDKLKVYAVLMFLISVVMTTFYALYCMRKFPESRYSYFFDKSRFKELYSFATWNVVGAIANVLRSQGINLLLNVFFNPAINAARGIAYYVNNALITFSNNFYTAVKPQIIKDYAREELEKMHELIFLSSRFAFYLMLVISLPILLITQPIMELWLVTPPGYTSLFVQLVVINSLIEVLSFPLVSGLQASGEIRTYQLVVSVAYMMNLPVSYVFLKLDYPPEVTMYVNISIVVACFVPRLILCRKYIGITLSMYFKNVLIRLLIVTIIAASLCVCVSNMFDYSTLSSILVSVCSILLLSMLCIYAIGLSTSERKKLEKMIIGKIRKT